MAEAVAAEAAEGKKFIRKEERLNLSSRGFRGDRAERVEGEEVAETQVEETQGGEQQE